VPLRRGGGTGQDQADENDQRHRGRDRPHATVTTRQVSLCANLAGPSRDPGFEIPNPFLPARLQASRNPRTRWGGLRSYGQMFLTESDERWPDVVAPI
jgi:hypothetical protein